ncbi:MAG: Zn-ribbon domain-containing OB-fold protein [Chloroflexi bacterium]|nr:Zn-ribbon domain-containing OB-fold protein [Chloroflexota bacterium]
MVTAEKKQFPVLPGAWTTPSAPGEKPHLIGSRCPACGEVFFPRKPKGRCTHCQHDGLEEIKLSRQGKIFTFTVVTQPPGGGYYHGPVPYAFGLVRLPEGVYVESPLVADDLDALKVGMDVELVIGKVWGDSEGNELIGFKFRTVQSARKKEAAGEIAR